MEKNTVLAVVLSTIVLIVFFGIQSNMAAKQMAAAQASEQSEAAAVEVTAEETDPAAVTSQPADSQITVEQPAETQSVEIEESLPQSPEHITIETNTVTVVLTSGGGDIVSFKLKDHLDKEESVDMIFQGENEQGAFAIAFGGAEAKPVPYIFNVNRISEHTIEFYRNFVAPDTQERFRLTKRYDFKPNDYMFELTVTLESENSLPNFSGNAYTLSFGPQIGPKFEKLDMHYDYRRYFAYTNGKPREISANKLNNIIDNRPSWLAISGKYFTFIAIPHIAQYNAKFTQAENKGNIPPVVSNLSIIRPAVNQRTVTDSYKFYIGPKSSEELNKYHTGSNDFGFKDSTLVGAASSGFWAPLVRLLRWLLLICYKIVPNYGMAIILMTLIIKLIFFPLTKKSSEATSRMQELGPKIKEIQEKYKGNSQKLNAEMAAFYQKEGYNPLSGCLPMLLQIPIFIGMYQLFNNHFDLRGASFIAGWIPDLSVPESIFDFPDNFRLPILGWTALRGLPFIYVASQLLYGKFTQTPGQQSTGQMKMMMYFMPIMFFFILYNVPSGLLIYWIFSNIFTLVQQVIINKYKHAKAVSQGQTQGNATVVEEQKTKIVPNKKKRRN